MEKERENGEGKTIPALGQPAMQHLPQNKLFNAKTLHKTTEKRRFEEEIKKYLNRKGFFFITVFHFETDDETLTTCLFLERVTIFFFIKELNPSYLGAGKLRGRMKITGDINIIYMYDAGYT